MAPACTAIKIKMACQYRNFAFISYSHRDIRAAKWLQRHLEGFKLPTEIHNDIDAGSRYLRPIFRDQSDLNTGVLGDELRKHLEQSKYLILICSKDSAKSTWVGDEAKTFVEMGRLDRIIPMIIPHGTMPERELFPLYLRNYFERYPEKELLGVNIGEVGKDKALVRVVSRMLGVSFDSLWKRHQRNKRLRIAEFSSLVAVFAVLAYLFAFPVSLTVKVHPQESFLPEGKSIEIVVNGAEYTAPFANPEVRGIRLPGYSRFKTIGISAKSPFFNEVDTQFRTGYGTHATIELPMPRNDSFSVFAGCVYDEGMAALEGVEVTVDGISSTTGPDGMFHIMVPLGRQREELALKACKDGYEYRRSGMLHSPGDRIKLMMHRKD